jgi:hypothetical protein
MIIRENIDRYFVYFDQTRSFYEYFISVPELFLPWAPLLIIALVGIFNQRYEPQSKLWTQKGARFARTFYPAAELRGIL